MRLRSEAVAVNNGGDEDEDNELDNEWTFSRSFSASAVARGLRRARSCELVRARTSKLARYRFSSQQSKSWLKLRLSSSVEKKVGKSSPMRDLQYVYNRPHAKILLDLTLQYPRSPAAIHPTTLLLSHLVCVGASPGSCSG
jgi:hypothetical protein